MPACRARYGISGLHNSERVSLPYLAAKFPIKSMNRLIRVMVFWSNAEFFGIGQVTIQHQLVSPLPSPNSRRASVPGSHLRYVSCHHLMRLACRIAPGIEAALA